MKASNSDSEDKAEATTFKGTLIQKKTGIGSKSEHKAVFLQTEKKTYQLRRVGGNAFADPELNKWIGKKVSVTGVVYGTLLMASSIKN